MKKSILLILSACALLGSVGFTSDEKPKISLCNNGEETEDAIIDRLQETRDKVSELAHDDQTVMKNYDEFADILDLAYHKERSMTAQEIQKICSGVEFAAEKHRLQSRKNPEKTPYISHPIGVAFNLMDTGDVRDSDVIIGALLHDTVEDTQTTFEEIESEFGKKVAGYVREVTSDKSVATEARRRLQVISAAHKSNGAAQIKLADKLFNLNDLLNNPPKDWTQARVDRYYEWAQSVVDRLPNANDKLLDAVDGLINSYWEKQAENPQE